MPSSAPSRATSPSRTIWWSSTTTTLMLTTPPTSVASVCAPAAATRAPRCRRWPGTTPRCGRPARRRARAARPGRRRPGRPAGCRRRRRRPRRARCAASTVEPDPDVRGRGVPGDVGERLADDPVRRHLDGRRQLAEVGRPRRSTVRTAALIRSACWRRAPTRPRSSSAGGRRSCTSRRTSATTSWTWRAGRGDRPLGGLRVRSTWQPRRLELEDHAAERGPEPVVQVAPDPAPLLLAGDDQPLAVVLELVGELAGARGGGRLPHQVAEQLLVAPGQPAAQPADRQHHPADLVAAVGDRQRADLGRRGAVRRDEPLAAGPVDLEADVGDAERRRHRVRDGGQLLGRPRRTAPAWRRGRPRRRTGWSRSPSTRRRTTAREPLPERAVEHARSAAARRGRPAAGRDRRPRTASRPATTPRSTTTSSAGEQARRPPCRSSRSDHRDQGGPDDADGHGDRRQRGDHEDRGVPDRRSGRRTSTGRRRRPSRRPTTRASASGRARARSPAGTGRPRRPSWRAGRRWSPRR